MIGLLDYGAGNLFSVQNALEHLGVVAKRVSNSEDLSGLSKLIFPGVGHFGPMMDALQARGLRVGLSEFLDRGQPILGICLGMQALFEGSDEAPDVPGLGVLPGRVEAFAPAFRSPHMGWAETRFGSETRWFYYAHSFRVVDSSWACARASHIEPFVAAVQRDNISGVQFHPEKSGTDGLEFLKGWLSQ